MKRNIMIEEIRKRDGRIVKLNRKKIVNAIFRAFVATGEGRKEDAEKLSEDVVSKIEKTKKIPSVEEVQDVVETTLMEHGFYRTAKAYILYREQHKKIREMKEIIRDISTIESYLNKEDWRVNENSNMTYSLQGLNYFLSSKVVSHYWLDRIYPREIKNAHYGGELHIHDLGILGAYCVGWDLRGLLLKGIVGVSGKVESK
ncbi:MAG TPA: ribonucleoside triphosphate reductase, partial [Euryarchaeota archaeon]|nr:ribonucleoside triphosphate reductase [Euryarchaeota archaeon]